jgi:3-dehydroquinate synthase
MKTQSKLVRVSLGARSYDVRIGSGEIKKLGHCLRSAPSKKAFLFSDERCVQQRAQVLVELEKAGWQVYEHAVIAGEPLKDMQNLFSVYGVMLKNNIDRSSTLIALGGGSVGDAAGFVASTFLRGIRWVGLPTTLLAQVDSSVGGKTAVNLPEGKNLVGSFHQPSLVISDTKFLRTLSRRELISGLGEVTKCALIFDEKFYLKVKKNWQTVCDFDDQVLIEMIATSVRMKAKAISQDEFDLKGPREVLNFGHTFGHALESVTGYGSFQHGEAIVWGMRFAIAVSMLRKKLNKNSWQEIDSFLKSVPVPCLPSEISFEEYRRAMSKDKKSIEGKVRFVLLKKIGESFLDRNVTEENLKQAFEIISR